MAAHHRVWSNDAVVSMLDEIHTIAATERAASSSEIAGLARRLAETEAARAAAEDRIAALERSTSWRLTAPLRVLTEWLRQSAVTLGVTRARPAASEGDGAAAVASAAQVVPRTVDAVAGYAEWAARQRDRRTGRIDGRRRASNAPLSIGIVLFGGNANTLQTAITTLQAQQLRAWSLRAVCDVDDAEMAFFLQGHDRRVTVEPLGPDDTAERAALAAEALCTDLIVFLDARDRLAPDALVGAHAAFAEKSGLAIAFADEDQVGGAGEVGNPFLKPGWDPELQLARDLMGGFVMYRASFIRKVGGPSRGWGAAWPYELATRAGLQAGPGAIEHIPLVLCHRHPPENEPVRLASMRDAARSRLPDGARLTSLASHPAWHRITYPMPSRPPLVSLIVPTRDKPELLRRCIDGVLTATEYSAIEVLIVDNGSSDPAACALLQQYAADTRVRVLAYPGPFNWAAFNNAAARHARGEVLVLLNNDIGIIEPQWLRELVTHAMRPGIGAVGAKLLYEDGRVQHAGIAMNPDGEPKHLLRYARCDDPGPFGLLALTRSVSAVTGACLAVRRDTFFEVGGLNEELQVACNDVDLCLRLAAHGYRNLWTPFAVLHHLELATRGPDATVEMRNRALDEVARLCHDWGGAAFRDPYLNPNIVLVHEQPHLALWDDRPPPPLYLHRPQSAPATDEAQ